MFLRDLPCNLTKCNRERDEGYYEDAFLSHSIEVYYFWDDMSER